MATLVNVTREGRLFLKVGGVIFGVLMILFIFIRGGTLISEVFFPKPPPPPEEAFGKLPRIIFPESNPTSINYTVNTVDGLLPVFPDRIDIYKIKSSIPNLLALNEAKNTLDSANFVENQVKITDTLYRWTQSKTGVTIEYDIVDHNFIIFSNYLVNPSLVSTGVLPSEDAIRSDMESFLRTIGANIDNLGLKNMKIELLELQNGGLIGAQNIGLARLARVTIPQEPINEIETVYGVPEKSLSAFVVSYPGSRFTVLEGIFYNHEADMEKSSDYSIKTSEEALEDLKLGKAYIMNPQNLTNVDITNVDLKYYLTKENQGFLLPVYVFTGVNFTAYVEALPEASIGTNEDPLPEVQN